MKKRLLGILLASSMLFVACGNSATESTSEATENTTTESTSETTENTDSVEDTSETINIVATSFHEYDWFTQVIGEQDGFSLSLLIDDGIDLHSYEPTVEDIANISSADLFIYNGGESDTWVNDILAITPDLNTINVIAVLDDKVQMSVLVEGMEADEDHDHSHEDEDTVDSDEDHDHEDTDAVESDEDHDHEDADAVESDEDHDHEDADAVESDEDHDHEDADAVDSDEDHDHEDTDAVESDEETHSHEDEHIWLSLDNATIMCAYFAEIVSTLDPDNADVYKTNATTYIAQLEELDQAYEEMVANASRDTVIVTDRFPFLYLFTDYDIHYYAAFEGCSAETEASFETVVFLAEKVEEYDVNYLLIVDNGLVALAETISSNTANADQEILTLDSMQSVSQADIDAGATYYTIMESNLQILTLALSE